MRALGVLFQCPALDLRRGGGGDRLSVLPSLALGLVPILVGLQLLPALCHKAALLCLAAEALLGVHPPHVLLEVIAALAHVAAAGH